MGLAKPQLEAQQFQYGWYCRWGAVLEGYVHHPLLLPASLPIRLAAAAARPS